ncbi:MAG: hypothetical protein QM504_05305 [Pseudomonadota bacterium]
MKLIIRQYLAALNERNELDAILPDLLSELGLNVYSRPGRGTRQDGVDVAAVGSLSGGIEKVYLFSIKAGNLTRNSWDGAGLQSLRPSLNEILDSYIPNRLPNEHKDKDIVICLCFGGDIQEQVRPQVEGYIKQIQKDNISFEEWNGDKLASLIQSSFMREELMPNSARSQLRKSLALLDEPEASYKHFSTLVGSLTSIENKDGKAQITAIRQINICLWILFAWSREAKNTEAAYLSSELVLLHGWELAKTYINQKNKLAQSIRLAFDSILVAHHQICFDYLENKICPHTNKLHALSTEIRGSCDLDVNLKLFDILGRLAMGGIWTYWYQSRLSDENNETKDKIWEETRKYTTAIKGLIVNNPILFLPIKDDQAIDICLGLLLLAIDNKSNPKEIVYWLTQMMEQIDFSLKIKGPFPCNINLYSDLLEHPSKEDGYLEENTSGSILYPMIAVWATLLEDSNLYAQMQSVKEQHLGHCNFQYWYPDENSEQYFYTNSDIHGATLSNVCIERTSEEFQEQVFGECEKSPFYNSLSAVEIGFWPLILIACRHYRLPIPLHLLQGFLKTQVEQE